MDEAAAALAIQIGSVPVEIDDLERRATSLEIEKAALAREKDANSKERLEAVEKEPRSGEMFIARANMHLCSFAEALAAMP